MHQSLFDLAVLCATICVQESVFGQGEIVFSNRIPPDIDARVTFLDGSGVGVVFIAQLFGGPAGTPVGALTPLFPTALFRTSTQVAMGYVLPPPSDTVRVPDVPPGGT